jgi:hypothetical protein
MQCNITIYIEYLFLLGKTLEVKDLLVNKNVALCQFDSSVKPDTKVYV